MQTRYYPSSQWAVNGTVPAGTLGTIMQEQPYQPRPDDNWYRLDPADSSWWWSVKFDNGQGGAIYGWVKESELVKAGQSYDFFLSNSGNIRTEAGQAVSTQISATQISGISTDVSFSVILPSSLEIPVKATFNQSSCRSTCSTTLTFNTSVNTPAGWHQIRVIGSGGGRSISTRFWLWINGSTVSPQVTISATDPVASEALDPGAFTITRTGSTTNPLTVWYTVLGSALWQEDYDAPLSGSIVIPAGANQVLLPITPKRDAIQEGDETITIRLIHSPNTYTVSAPYQATVILKEVQN